MESTISDLIIRIKNGYMAGLPSITVPYSVFREAVITKLVSLAYLKSYKKEGRDLVVELSYDHHVPVVTDIKIFTRPGRRHYVSYKKLTSVLGGLGHSILSTSRGILTNGEARKAKVGGELLFNIW